jgi:autotransporter-associated beta strand protein
MSYLARTAGSLALIVIICAMPGVAERAEAQASLWNNYQGSSSVQLNFVPGTGGNLHYLGATVGLPGASPSSSITFNQANVWTVDTGSEGMLITADYLKNSFGINAASFGKPSNQTIAYTSSGNTYTGFYQPLSVGLYNAKSSTSGNLAATANTQVFIATQFTNGTITVNLETCGSHCTGSLEQMGVGFGRGYPYSGPAPSPPRVDTNPLMNLTSAAASVAPGYVVTSTYVQLGLTSAQLQNAALVKLLPIAITPQTTGSAWQIAATASDWQTPAMTLTINNAGNAATNGTYYGSLLVDTGLANVELATGNSTSPKLTFNAASPAQSSSLQIYLPGASSSQGQPLAYTLLYQGSCATGVFTCPTPNQYQNTVGLSPVYPSNSNNAPNDGIDFVTSTTNGSPAFINTGENFLNYFNIVYDPVSGFFGYQVAQDPTQTSNNPTLQPSIALQGSVAIPSGTTIATPTLLFEQFTGIGPPQAAVQLSSPGQVTISGPISSALYCSGGACTATGLEISGGTFVLTANNPYLGGTQIDPGATLGLTGTGSIANSAGVTANGMFDISGTSSGASIMSLSGAGMVNLGGQTLTLTNAAGMFGGTIGGSGKLVIGGGTQTLTGTNTYSGGTTVTGGATLGITSDAALGNTSGSLTLNSGTLLALNSLAISRSIIIESGGGVIDSNGFQLALNGSLEVDGPFSTTGAVTLPDSNALSINDDFSVPTLHIGASGTLRGIGRIHSLTRVDGVLAPGNSPGTLTFTAPVVLGPGSTTQFDIDGTGTGTGAGNYSRVIVTGVGNTYTAGGTLLPLLRRITGSATNTYTPPIGQNFLVVSAQGGLVGSYATLTQPVGLAPGTRFDALYSPTTLDLVVTPASYGNLALAGLPETSNQSAVGSALDAARPLAGIAMNATQAATYGSLYLLPAAAVTPTLEQLAPTIYGDALMVTRSNWYLVSGAISEQLEARRGSRPGNHAQIAPGPDGRTIWVTGLGQFGNVYSNGAAGYTSSSGGVAAGVDVGLNQSLLVGAAIGFTNQSTSAQNSASFTGQAFQFGLYGSLRQGIAFVEMQAGGLFSEGSAGRPLSAYGVEAKGNTNGAGGGGSVRAGVRLDAAEWQIEPSLMLAGVGLSQGSLTETQAGPAGLSIGAASVGSVQTQVGVRAERRFAVGTDLAIVPSVQLGWLHEYLDTDSATRASFIAAPGIPFAVQSAPIGRDAAVIGVRAALDTAGPFSVYASYVGTLNGNGNAQTVSAGLRFVW